MALYGGREIVVPESGYGWPTAVQRHVWAARLVGGMGVMATAAERRAFEERARVEAQQLGQAALDAVNQVVETVIIPDSPVEVAAEVLVEA